MPGPTDPSIPPVDDRPLMTPAGLLGTGSSGVVPEPLPERAVLVFDDSYVPRRGRRRRPAPFRRVALARTSDGPVAIVAAVGPGAPTVAVTVEFLHHLGVRSLISVGLAGALDDTARPGQVRSVDDAVSEEGTSAGYGSHLLPDHNLNEALKAATNTAAVTAVSTDTPLRHGAADLARFRESAQVVEMELAAMFSVADHVGVAAAALVVISDCYTEDSWSLGDPALTRPVMDNAIELANQVLIGFHHEHEDQR